MQPWREDNIQQNYVNKAISDFWLWHSHQKFRKYNADEAWLLCRKLEMTYDAKDLWSIRMTYIKHTTKSEGTTTIKNPTMLYKVTSMILLKQDLRTLGTWPAGPGPGIESWEVKYSRLRRRGSSLCVHCGQTWATGLVRQIPSIIHHKLTSRSKVGIQILIWVPPIIL